MASDLAVRLAVALRNRKADTAFGVPGGGPNLDLIAAMAAEGIGFVLAHSETAACIMASTYGSINGALTPVIVTRGPGAASAVNGVAQATLDRQSLVLIADTVPSEARDRVAHQRIDQRALFDPVTVGSLSFNRTTPEDELAVVLNRATRWPRGAVLIDYDASDTPTGPPFAAFTPSKIDQVENDPTNYYDSGHKSADRSVGEQVRGLLASANKPVVLLGAAVLAAEPKLSDALISFGAPILSTYQAAGFISSEDDLYAGLFTNGATERPLLDQADLIIAIGLDMVEPIPAPWTYDAPVISLATQPTTDPYLPIRYELVDDLWVLAADFLSQSNGSRGWSPKTGAEHRRSVRERLRGADEPGQSSDGIDPIDLVTTTAACAPSPVSYTRLTLPTIYSV